MTKTCSVCREEKPLTSFHKRGGDRIGVHSHCKLCHRAYYKAKGQEYNARFQRDLRRRKRAWVLEQKVAAGCARCPERHPACLDFHHLVASEKEIEVVKLVDSNAAWERIQAEMAKCLVLCSNCHRKEHYGQRAALAVA